MPSADIDVRARGRAVLACAGGADTSAAIEWLTNTTGAEVVTVTVDLGQGADLEEIRDRALAAGAVRAHVLDLKEEFVRELVIPALRAGALAEERARLAAALPAPIVAKALVDVGRIEQARVLAHGGEPGGRVELSVRALNREAAVIAHGWPVSTSADVRPWVRPAPPAPGPAFVDLSFDGGAPVAINGVAMPILDLMASLTTIAAAHGIGRPGARGLVESPALAVLETGLRALQNAVASPEAERFSAIVAREYADLVLRGLWCSPLREALDAYVGQVQARTTGHVRLTLFNGHCDIHDDTLVRAV